MTDFEKVSRYSPEDVQLGHMPWEQCRGSMWEDEVGDFVQYEDYQDLLEAYKELKWRMEQLEK